MWISPHTRYSEDIHDCCDSVIYLVYYACVFFTVMKAVLEAYSMAVRYLISGLHCTARRKLSYLVQVLPNLRLQPKEASSGFELRMSAFRGSQGDLTLEFGAFVSVICFLNFFFTFTEFTLSGNIFTMCDQK